MGPEPSSPPGTVQVDGTLAQWAQLLRALAPGAGPPPGRKESMLRRMAGSQGSSHLPICWGSLAQEETQVKHPSQAALPLRELTGVRGHYPLQEPNPYLLKGVSGSDSWWRLHCHGTRWSWDAPLLQTWVHASLVATQTSGHLRHLFSYLVSLLWHTWLVLRTHNHLLKSFPCLSSIFFTIRLGGK